LEIVNLFILSPVDFTDRFTDYRLNSAAQDKLSRIDHAKADIRQKPMTHDKP
jgi:hypothetical protein